MANEKRLIDADAVEVVHGRWIDAREFCGDYICSNCESLYSTNKFNYCPNCGADMRGVEDGKETNQDEILGHTPN